MDAEATPQNITLCNITNEYINTNLHLSLEEVSPGCLMVGRGRPDDQCAAVCSTHAKLGPRRLGGSHVAGQRAPPRRAWDSHANSSVDHETELGGFQERGDRWLLGDPFIAKIIITKNELRS